MELSCSFLHHPPYSPDIPLNNYSLFFSIAAKCFHRLNFFEIQKLADIFFIRSCGFLLKGIEELLHKCQYAHKTMLNI